MTRDGAPAWFAGRGTVDGVTPVGDTQYRIGSLTKMFVAVAVLRLRDEGALRLTDPLGQHLPTAAAGACASASCSRTPEASPRTRPARGGSAPR